MLPLIYPGVPSKNVCPIGPAVWPAIGNIYILMSYYTDDI